MASYINCNIVFFIFVKKFKLVHREEKKKKDMAKLTEDYLSQEKIKKREEVTR